MAEKDLTALLLDALGKRIDDPAAVRLASALGNKPFKNATDSSSYLVNRKLGLEVGAKMLIQNRSYWPYRKEGRLWVTWVSFAFLYPNYQGSLPAGFDWSMDDTALRAHFESRVEGALRVRRFFLTPPREGLEAIAQLGFDGRADRVFMTIAEERDLVTIHPGSRPEHNIEGSFFVAWCVMNGILREGRLDVEQIAALNERRMTPLAFFSTALGGLLWENDVKPEFDSFCHAYMNRLIEPDEASHLHDVEVIFGKLNYWRKPGEPLTEDSWANYDRIAPRYTQRLTQWRQGELSSRVDFPAEATRPEHD